MPVIKPNKFCGGLRTSKNCFLVWWNSTFWWACLSGTHSPSRNPSWDPRMDSPAEQSRAEQRRKPKAHLPGTRCARSEKIPGWRACFAHLTHHPPILQLKQVSLSKAIQCGAKFTCTSNSSNPARSPWWTYIWFDSNQMDLMFSSWDEFIWTGSNQMWLSRKYSN